MDPSALRMLDSTLSLLFYRFMALMPRPLDTNYGRTDTCAARWFAASVNVRLVPPIKYLTLNASIAADKAVCCTVLKKNRTFISSEYGSFWSVKMLNIFCHFPKKTLNDIDLSFL